MRSTKIVFCGVTILLLPMFGFCRQPLFDNTIQEKRVEQLEQRVRQLENYKSNLDNLSDIRSENLKKYVNDEISKGLENIEEAKKMITLVLWLGLPLTVGSVIVGYFAAIRKARKLIIDKIETIVEGKRDEIIRLIETEAFDTRLRNMKELLVISGDGDSEESLKKFMDKLRFKKVKYRKSGDTENIPEHDLMIFNTPDGNLTQETIDQFMRNTEDEDTCYVAYTNKQLNRDPRLNFSNSRYTLYHSILSTLKFAEITRLKD